MKKDEVLIEEKKLAKLKDSEFPSYLVTDTKWEEPSFIERSLIRTELIGEENQICVRFYQVVYAPAIDIRRKDTTQDEAGSIIINGTKNVWMNLGNPYRAIDFAKKYKKEGLETKEQLLKTLQSNGQVKHDNHIFTTAKDLDYYYGRPIIRSFLVPIETYKQITSNAIEERQSSVLGDYTKNSDQSRAADQYGLNSADLNLIRKTALKNSLISYVLDDYYESYELDKKHGTVVRISDLIEELGISETYLEDPVLELEESEKKAEKLNTLYNKTAGTEEEQSQKEIALELEQEGISNNYLTLTAEEKEEVRQTIAKKATSYLLPTIFRHNYNEATKHANAYSKVFKANRAGDIEQVETSKWMDTQEFKSFAFPKK